jgi:serine/threonine-protein kinase
VEYALAGSEFAVEVIGARRPGPNRPDRPRPVSKSTRSTRDDFERLSRGELPGLVLADRYRLERRIGRGGMGSVYFGRHLVLGRPVAVKVLDIEDHQAWRGAVAQFLREARLAAKVRHRNIVDVLDFGSTPDGVVYIVMEALLGRDLRAIVSQRRLAWSSTRYLMQQVCAAIDAIHRVGVVHRDLKASNCFYVEHMRLIKLLDFGIAAPVRETKRAGPADSAADCTIVGTPEYMAPEQIRGAPADRRSDVYAGGILLFELLTGRTPFAGQSVEHVFDLHLEAEPPTLASVVPDIAVPNGLDAIVARALAKEPRRRFQSMREFAAALDGVGLGSRLRRRLPRLFGGRRESPDPSALALALDPSSDDLASGIELP